MENSYGIGVANRYELFYDDDLDPYDIIKETDVKKPKDKQAEKENKGGKVLGKKSTSILKKTTNNEKGTKVLAKTNANNDGKVSNRGRGEIVKFSDREERNNRRNRPDDFNANRFDGERRTEGEGGRARFDGEGQGGGRGRFDGEGRGRGRGRGMGRGRGRGRGGMGGPDSRGKREFDRQSGMVTSGVKAVDKREGSGSFNWGSDKDQIEDYQANEEPTAELDTSNENVEKVEETNPPENEEVVKEEEHKQMTLDEYRALQKKQRSKPQFNTRKAGEGENTTQWKKTYVLKKKETDEDESEEEEEEDDDDDEIQHGRRKVVLDIDFKFSDSPVRGRGRGRGRGGDRGRGRGDRARGGMGDRSERGRGDRARGGRMGGRQEAPRMDDEHDFPSLG